MREWIQESRNKVVTFLFVSHLHSEHSCARADIMETNRPWVGLSLFVLAAVILLRRIWSQLNWRYKGCGWSAAPSASEAKRGLNERRARTWEKEREREDQRKWIRRATESKGGFCESPEGIHRRFAMSKFTRVCRLLKDGLFDTKRGRLPTPWSIFLECVHTSYELLFLNGRWYMKRVLEIDRFIIKFHEHFVLEIYHFLSNIIRVLLVTEKQ